MTRLTSLSTWRAALEPFGHRAERRLRDWRKRRAAWRTAAMLHDLSDHHLADIGVRRSEIDLQFG